MDSKLTLGEAQRLVDEWIQNYGVRYFAPLTNMAILTEEVGEVARLMSRLYGEQSFKKSDEGHNLGDELADVLWVVLCIANQDGRRPRGGLSRPNIEKETQRDSERHRTNPKLVPDTHPETQP